MERKHWEIIRNILTNYPYQFYAFGSRTKHQAKQYSDLDLCYKDKIPDHIIVELEDKFIESDLPFKVEFVSWHRCTPEFQRIIEQDLIPLDLTSP